MEITDLLLAELDREANGIRKTLERVPEGKKGREVLQKTSDDHLLNTKWRMRFAGKLMSEQPRDVAIRDGVLNHMAHHRGQLTVYLRLNEEKVPAIYGPAADERSEERRVGEEGRSRWS